MYVCMYVCMFTFCHSSSDLIYYPFLIELHTGIGIDKTANKFAFDGNRIKVKVAVAIFTKNAVKSYSHFFNKKYQCFWL